MHSAWWREEREFSKHSTVPADCVYPTGCFGCPILHLVLAGNAIALSFSSRSATTGQNPAPGHSRAVWAGADEWRPFPISSPYQSPCNWDFLSLSSEVNGTIRWGENKSPKGVKVLFVVFLWVGMNCFHALTDFPGYTDCFRQGRETHGCL